MKYIFLIGTFLLSFSLFSKTEKGIPLSFKNDLLVYQADSLKNRIPDFSYAGYMGGGVKIPTPQPTVYVPSMEGDATNSIQQALDYVGALKPDAEGIRGVVLLEKGNYHIAGTLILRNSGVILRGNGMHDGTKLVATGKDRRTLIRICGVNNIVQNDTIKLTNTYVPVNAFSFAIDVNHNLKTGDKIFIHRPSVQEWIDVLGTDHFGGGITALGWKPGRHDIYWDRTVVSVDGSQITIDAPITTALDAKYGGGNVIPYVWKGRISHVGVENMTCISEYNSNNPKDEEHAWTGITVENAQDVWVRNMAFIHFAGSAIFIESSVKRITVENCKFLEPVSEMGGLRRNAFFTAGQQCLFQGLYSENAIHDFSLGLAAAGPNAFVQCYAFNPSGFSGGLDGWASGVIFDNVNIDGNALSYKNRFQEGQGAGWNAANSVFWQSTASLVECFAPPTAQNWAFGIWSEFSGDGYWGDSNNHINPQSLYSQQLKERLGGFYEERTDVLMPYKGEASSSPKVDVANALTQEAATPALTLSEWIDWNVNNNPLPVDMEGVKRFEAKNTDKTIENASPLLISNGWLVRGNRVQTGGKHDIRWWSGTTRPDYLKTSGTPHLTRYVPSRTGTGLTDDVNEVAVWMKDNNVVALDHNYGLWYDRRRDDHERIRRINGDVWAPFYEQPFARSGQGTAYDGLSKYDLTQFNDWYWMRLKQFADLADQESLVLFHQNYFQHNIIEAGAHWADSPWRTANNINEVGFPEPVPYAGDKRIFFAEQFYDINHPVRRELHRGYIRQCLDNFKDNNGIVQFISAEYTGPLHFVEFWLDVIGEWEDETGRKQLIALSTTKDVQDSILADPVRLKLVDIIDIRYWQPRADGTVYEPKGGQNLAPRQHARLENPGKASFESIYNAISDYKTRFPEKAVTYYAASYPQYAWAVFMGKGSLAAIPNINNNKFLHDASEMDILPQLNFDGQYVLGNSTIGYIVYSENTDIRLNLEGVKGKFNAYWINIKSGETEKMKHPIKGNTIITLPVKGVLWLEKK